MIKTIIFDLGNVIVNVDKSKFRMFSRYSNKSVKQITKCIEESTLMKSFERGELSEEDYYKKVSKELNLKMDFEKFKSISCGIFSPRKDVEKLIRKLKKRFRLVLLSNTDAIHFEFIKKNYKILNAFDDYVLSYKEGCRKPNPLIFLKAIKKAKTSPFNCLYFDDISEFVLAARMLGIKAFQYKNFEKLRSDLKRFKEVAKVL